ncbi:MAG: 2-hydroxyhepta-2,4-diene-1,7-dioate isomerase [Acidovorax sp.]|nr:MAG: 2-hydroxyhepta-2,4-diene-1,7-dioate isomerase [Acidovorax sp.]
MYQTPQCAPCRMEFAVAPFRLSGAVYGALLNHRPAAAALGDAVHQPPYKAPAVAPVLYVKPRNTLAGHGDAIVVPADAQVLEVGASLGIVIGRAACRVAEQDALAYVAGYTIVGDISVPHGSFYRPSIRFKARDGFCPIGLRVVPRSEVADPDALAVQVRIDGALVHETTTSGRIRPVARLLAEVSEFMTLSPGDVLLLGASAGAPRVRSGQQVRIAIDGLGELHNHFIAEGGAP